jgi:DNA-nicking Smr family endonuclease
MSDDDKKISSEFREYIGKVIPIHHDHLILSKSKSKNKIKLTNSKITLPRFASSIQQVSPHEFIEFAKPGLREKELRELKKGSYRCQARLDLHGLNVEQAYAELITFIQHCQLQGMKCVRIIHGKGRHSETPAVLKNQINQWLRQMAEILAFCSAQAKDGGTGAVYVLLKKIKK